MKRQIILITLSGLLASPLAVLAQDFGGTQPPPNTTPPPSGNQGIPLQNSGQFFQPSSGDQFRNQQQLPPGEGQNFGPQQFNGQPPFGEGQKGTVDRQFNGQFPNQPFGTQSGDNQKQFNYPDQPQGDFSQQKGGGGQTRSRPMNGEQPPGKQQFQGGQEENQKRPSQNNEEQNQGQGQRGGFFGDEEMEGENPEDYVDPREIQQVQKQIKDLKKQAARLQTKVQKNASLANEASNLQELVGNITKYEEGVKSGSRDALQEFYDAELWETLNGFQARIEIPAEIQKIEKDLAKLEKLITVKTFSIEGFDIAIIRSKIAEIKEAVGSARSALSSNDAESAREALQVIYEGSHPGEMYGVLQQLRQISVQLKTVKNAEVKKAILEVISPAYEAITTGDFREANMALNEINKEIFSLFAKLKSSRTVNTDLQTKMRTLEQKLETRIQQIEKTSETSNQSGMFVPYKSSQSASVISSLFGTIKSLFGR